MRMKKASHNLDRLFNSLSRNLPLIVLGLSILALLVYDDYPPPIPDSDSTNSIPPDFIVRGVVIPNNLNFCGERIPISNLEVRKNLTRELLQNAFDQPKTLSLNKRANRYFKIIEPILKKNGVPDDFKYVAIVESGFTNSPNDSNACGFWGLMIPVAQSYGLEINDEVDERFNIEKSTEAACKCFKDSYKKYKSWTLAAAAYDMGTGALDNQIEKQKTSDFFSLNLNAETSRYIYRLLAFKEVISSPEDFGYKLKANELYYPIPTYTVKIDSSISNLSAFAIANHSNYQILKAMNPWLLKNSLTNPDHKEYEIIFPKKGVKLYGMDELDSAIFVVPSIPDSLKKTKSDSVVTSY